MTFVRLAFFPDGTAEHHRALAAAIGDVQPPPGRLCFVAGPADGGWQVVQVWRSRAELDDFNRAVFLPALHRQGGAGFPSPPTVTDFEAVHTSFADGASERRSPAGPRVRGSATGHQPGTG